MKKITNLIFIIISLLLLVSCSAARVGDVFLVGVSDGLSDDAISAAINETFSAQFSANEFRDQSVSQTAQITVMGETYTGQYKYSDRGLRSARIRDNYEDDEGNAFAITRENGRLSYFDKFLVYDEMSPIACTIDEGKGIAVSFLETITDIENYTMTSMTEITDFAGSVILGYRYSFTRFINGIETNDKIYINVDSRRAVVCKYISYSVGEFAGVTLPDGFNLSASIEKISAQTSEIWASAHTASAADASGEPSFAVATDSCRLVMTGDGRLALCAGINVSRENTPIKELMEMLIIIN